MECASVYWYLLGSTTEAYEHHFETGLPGAPGGSLRLGIYPYFEVFWKLFEVDFEISYLRPWGMEVDDGVVEKFVSIAA